MAYQNPEPILHDEKFEEPVRQEIEAAEYRQIKNVYFAFIDVLGFKQTFDDNRENPDMNVFAEPFKETFQYFSRLMNMERSLHTENQWNSGQTSDSLYFYTARIDYLIAFIKIYAHHSLYAMSHNVFLRGGIAKGDLFVKLPHQFYGDSVIKAYLLESTVARNPRVVIDQNTLADLRGEKGIMDFITEEKPPKRSFIKPFTEITVNDLQSILNIPAVELNEIDQNRWDKIEDYIDENMRRFEFEDKNYQKYAFLKDEYETFMDLRDK